MYKRTKLLPVSDNHDRGFRSRSRPQCPQSSTSPSVRGSRLSRSKTVQPVLTEEDTKFLNELLQDHKFAPKDKGHIIDKQHYFDVNTRKTTVNMGRPTSDCVTMTAEKHSSGKVVVNAIISKDLKQDQIITKERDDNIVTVHEEHFNLSEKTRNGLTPSHQRTSQTGVDATQTKSGSDENKDDSFLDLDLLLSQEPLLDSSQDGGYECEVRWDCRSPETIRQLKKLRGQYSAEGVKKIMANFKDVHVKPPKPSLRSTELFLPSKDTELSQKARLQKAKDRAAKKRPQRARSKQAAEAMIRLLHEMAAKQDSGNKDSADASSKKSSESCDKVTEAAGGSEPSSTCDNGDDDCWSDEDLFKDNSFLIEATQNPEKFLNTSRDLAAVIKKRDNNLMSLQTGGANQSTQKELCSPNMDNITQTAEPNSSASLFDDSAVIASSCVSRQSAVLTSKSSVMVPVKPTFTSLSSSSSFGKTSSTSSSSSSSCGTGGKSVMNKPNTYPSQMIHRSNSVAKTAINGSTMSNVSNNRISSNSVGRFNFKPLGAGSSNHNSSCSAKLSNSHAVKPISAYNTKFTSSINKFVNEQSKSVVNPTPVACVRPSFRKFNSFQSDILSAQPKLHPAVNKQSPNSGLSTSFRKTLSFDNLCSPGGKVSSSSSFTSKSSCIGHSNGLGKPAVTSAVTNFSSTNSSAGQLSRGKPWPPQSGLSVSVHKNGIPFQSNKSQSSTDSVKTSIGCELVNGSDVSSRQEDGFDLNLPDDVLLQLLEPDEILDSQADLISSTSAVNAKSSTQPNTSQKACVNKTAVPSLVCKGPSEKLESRCVTNTSSRPISLAVTSTVSNSKNNIIACGTLKPFNRQSDMIKVTEAILSPVKPVADIQNSVRVGAHVPVHTYFKKTFSVQKPGSPHPLKALKHHPLSGPASSTPIKHAKLGEETFCSPNKTAENNQGFSDSFLENAFDDSFMNDEALFESQILPMLEKAESEAATQETVIPRVPVCSPAKCSPEEIEQKRQAALQRRSLRLSQMSKTSTRK